MKEVKADEKEKKDNKAEAGDGTAVEAGAEAGAKPEKTVKVKFRNAYVGSLGHYSAGQEYDLTKAQYDLFKDDCEVLKKDGVHNC